MLLETISVLKILIKSTTKGSRVRLPDDTIIAATDEGNLPIPDLPSVATHAHTFPARQLCDSDCSALFTKDSLKVYNHRNNLAVLMGRCNYNNGLWDVNISSSQSSAPQTSPPSLSTASLNAVLRYDKTKAELATYIHTAAGCPTKSSFMTAIRNGNFLTWPGLTTELISKHLLPSIPTAKGHLKQEQENLRSTKSTTVPTIKIEPEQDAIQEAKQHECYQ